MAKQFGMDNKNFDFVLKWFILLSLVVLQSIDKETLRVFKYLWKNVFLVEAKVFSFFVAAQFKLYIVYMNIVSFMVLKKKVLKKRYLSAVTELIDCSNQLPHFSKVQVIDFFWIVYIWYVYHQHVCICVLHVFCIS